MIGLRDCNNNSQVARIIELSKLPTTEASSPKNLFGQQCQSGSYLAVFSVYSSQAALGITFFYRDGCLCIRILSTSWITLRTVLTPCFHWPSS
jgi:hypothetical protein